MFTPLVFGYALESVLTNVPAVAGPLVGQEGQSVGLADRWPDLNDKRGFWRLSWDDKVDGRVDGDDKNCLVFFVMKKDSFVGNMTELPGEDRVAAVSGQFVQVGMVERGLLTFKQTEGAYVCSYQIFLNGFDSVGTWTDTHGRSGDFKLMKYQ